MTRRSVLADLGEGGRVAVSRQPKKIDLQVRKWRDDLIDLTRRNRLINLVTAGQTVALEIAAPGLSVVIARLEAGGKWRFHSPLVDPDEVIDESIQLALQPESHDLQETLHEDELLTNAPTAPRLFTRLRTMSTRASAEYLDKGLRVLYLAVGILEWEDAESNPLKSPLVLIPVTLERGTPIGGYSLLSAEEDRSSNPALRVKLEQEFGFDLPTLGDDESVDAYLERVRRAVKSQGWNVVDSVVLSTLSFAKETMYQDLKDNESMIVEHPLVRALADGESSLADSGIERISEDELDIRFPPENLQSILDADATQRKCIVAAKQGSSFVMDGPPGSGKSQTIANIIAELLGDGKSILFVSEKAAALEVVKKRLDSAYLGEFVLELHSHNATRKEVAAALGGAVGKQVEPPRRRSTSVRELGERRRALSEYAHAMNEHRPEMEETFHDVLGRCGELGERPVAPPPDEIVARLDRRTLDELLNVAAGLANSWDPVDRGSDFLWRDLSEVGQKTSIAAAEALLDGLASDLQALKVRSRSFASALDLEPPRTIPEVERFVRLSRLLAERPVVEAGWLATDALEALLNEANHLRGLSDERSALVQNLETRTSEWPELVGDNTGLVDIFDRLAARFDRDSIADSPAASLESVQGSLTDLMAILDRLEELSRSVGGMVGLGLEDHSLSDIPRLLELVALADRPDHPEPSWVDPAVLDRVRSAFQAVRVLVTEWNDQWSKVSSLFNPNIEVIDIESLYDGPNDVVPKLSRFTGRGRALRKQLRATCAGGKISPEVLAALPTVRSWKSLDRQLSEFEQQSLLGSYFAGPRTNVPAVENAISTAQSALEFAGLDADLAALGRAVSATDPRGAEISALAEELRREHTKWQQSIAEPGLRFVVVAPSGPIAGVRNELDDNYRLITSLQQETRIYRPREGWTVRDVLEVASQRSRVALIDSEFAAREATHDFGSLFDSFRTDWEAVLLGLSWCSSVTGLFEAAVDADAAFAITEASTDSELEGLFDRVNAGVERVLSYFVDPQQGVIRAEVAGRLDDLQSFVADLRTSSADIETWIRFTDSLKEIDSLGASCISDHLLFGGFSGSDVVPVFERTLLRAWVDRILRSDARLQPPLATDRDAIALSFKEMDAQLAELAARRVIDCCNRRRPVSLVGESAILRREAEKKRKHMPVRTLLSSATTAALDVKPCFMMSPLAVSQFLPPGMTFDVVIFDEASQVRPGDAINAIYRGRQLIIAGDERQMPPTSFFDRTVSDSGDDYDEDETVDFESVLKLAKGAAGIDELPLQWHYRSRHESLITFSNRMFYESNLITYPGAVDEAPDLGVGFHLVPEGIYRRGGERDNPVEAKVVVERVLHFARSFPHLTVGVVAFSEAQASRIDHELEIVRQSNRDLDGYFAENRLDGFFIKNLESVQGDERDVVIFSVGYGRDENGKNSANFGPLNKQGGVRRLNVAITRARRRVEVVSSISAHDIATASGNEGVAALRRYLDFAERGMAAFADDEGEGGSPESPFEEEVLRAISSMGFDVVPQVGQAGYRIDMAVRHPDRPGEFVLGIECDGAQYHSSRVARDRDRLRQEVLEGLGWRLHRIWGTAWYRDKSNETNRLRNAIDAAISSPRRSQSSRAARPSTRNAKIVEVDPDERLDGAVDFQWVLPRIKGLKDFDDPSTAPQIRSVVKSIIESNAPIHPDSIVDRIREMWALGRISAPRRTRIESAIESLRKSGEVQKDRFGFFWAAGEMTVVLRLPAPGEKDSRRDVDQVSPDELKLVMFRIVQAARSIPVEDLYSRAARLFGWRLVPETTSAFDRAFRELKKSKSLAIEKNLAGEQVVRSTDEHPVLD